MRLTPHILACALVACTTTIAQANESAYTERNLDACETISQTDEGPSITMKCGGYKDLAVYFKEGDLRQSQAYGPISKIYLDEAFESFGPFNHTNAKIEWRLGHEWRADRHHRQVVRLRPGDDQRHGHALRPDPCGLDDRDV